MESLDHEKLVELLCKLLSMGRGSLDFAKKAVAPGAPDHPSPPGEQPPWCQCHIFRPMETEQENVCCKKRTCITSYNSFSNICLDRDILEVCIKARCDLEPTSSILQWRAFARLHIDSMHFGHMANWGEATEESFLHVWCA